jgi:small subunit ribosomal protein S6
MYELLSIIPSPFTEKDLPEISKKTKDLIENLGGKVINEENLGNKKFAYPIKQAYRGFYILIGFEIEPKKIKELDQKLRMTPDILRHIITMAIPKPEKRAPRRRQAPKEQEKDFSADGEEKQTENVDEGNELNKKLKEEEGEKKTKKIDLKKLGEKIDDLFNNI